MTLLDDFNRANGAIGSNWTADPVSEGFSAPGIASNKAATTGGSPNSVYWNVETFGPDFVVDLIMGIAGGKDNFKGVRLYGALNNPAGGSEDGYEIWLVQDAGSGTNDLCTIGKYSGGSASFPVTTNPTNYQDGDIVRLTVDGGEITVERNRGGSWSTLATWTDSSPLGAGYVGFLVDPNKTADDFSASTILHAQIARPDADLATAGWTSTPLFSKIDEVTADDGDFITATASKRRANG